MMVSTFFEYFICILGLCIFHSAKLLQNFHQVSVIFQMRQTGDHGNAAKFTVYNNREASSAECIVRFVLLSVLFYTV